MLDQSESLDNMMHPSSELCIENPKILAEMSQKVLVQRYCVMAEVVVDQITGLAKQASDYSHLVKEIIGKLFGSLFVDIMLGSGEYLFFLSLIYSIHRTPDYRECFN